MKFGINAQVIIALLGALYILMVCREKYRVEYAEGESVAVEKVEKNGKKLTRKERVLADKEATAVAGVPRHKGPHPGITHMVRPAVMPKPGSPEFIVSKARRAEKNSIIEEEEEAAIEGQVMIEEEGMSTGAIAGITAVSIVALIVIMIMMRRLRR